MQTKEPKFKPDFVVNTEKVRNSKPLNRKDAKFASDDYKRNRVILLQKPNEITKIFNNCHTTDTKYPECQVWNSKTYEGKLATQGGQPRFGAGKLAPEPANSPYARRYIYLTKYPWMAYIFAQDRPRRIKMWTTCHPLCVNYKHMLPKPDKKPTPKGEK